MESSLYPPVKHFLESRSYTVRAEVAHSDVAALRNREDGSEELLVVELKQGFTIDLVLQGVKRQKSADLVYLAVPRPKRFWFESRWRDILHLLRRLELGLMLVDTAESQVEIVLEPQSFDRVRSVSRGKKLRSSMIREIEERSGDYNVGGSTGIPLVTAYRERALRVARILGGSGNGMSIRQLKDAGSHPGTTSAILQRNPYGWFVREDRGVYALTPAGRAALQEFALVAREKGTQ